MHRQGSSTVGSIGKIAGLFKGTLNNPRAITAKDVTRAIAKALVSGHSDAIQTRVVALAIHAGILTTKDAVRNFNIPASTLYAAKADLNEAILSECKSASLTNENNASAQRKEGFTVNGGTGAVDLTKVFP